MPGFENAYLFAARLRDFPMAMRPAIKATMAEAAQAGEDYAKMLAPYRTGRLRSSIDFRATTDHGWTFVLQAAASAPYAAFVEYGTSRMGPQPFFNPGVELTADMIEDNLGIVMRGL